MESNPNMSTGKNLDLHSNLLNPAQSLGLASKSTDYLAEIMDQYHKTVDVYSDADAAGNHFSARGAMVADGGDVNKVPYMKEDISLNSHSGITTIECTFSPAAGAWSGWYFLNGNLTGTEKEPGSNWGTLPNAGVNLSGATTLSFWARGATGGEIVEFLVCGVGHNATYKMPFGDSSRDVRTGKLTLSTTWTKYSIDLRGKDLSYVLGGFGWAATAADNGNQNITFYLDDIQYDKAQLDEPRFLVSYKTINSSNDFDKVLRNTAFTYDNAIALLAFIAENNLTRARLVADALVYAQNHDRYFDDGRIRNGYMGGDLVLPDGWTPNGRSNTVRMSGFYNSSTGKWYEDKFQVSTHTGNVAWTMIALLSMYEKGGNDKYLLASERMGDWVEFNCYNSTGIPGYTGGFEGWERDQTPLTYKSTEHNIDLYVAFTKLYQITNNSTWNTRAGKARVFLDAMWDSSDGKFWIGTLPDGSTLNTNPIVLDVQAWSNLAFDDTETQYQRAITYSEQYLSYGDGFGFKNNTDGVWNEGTAQMAVAYQKIGRITRWNDVVAFLKLNRTSDGGIFATDSEQLSTGLDVTDGIPWIYYHRLHVGATGWMIFAEKGLNPYWLGTNNEGIAIFRPSTGYWYFDCNLDGIVNKSFRYGGSTDQIIAGDWDGDGKDGIAIFRPSTGYWYFDYNLDGIVNKSFRYGGSTDHIVTGDWDGHGKDGIAIFRPSTGYWYFDYNLDGIVNKSFRYGGSTDRIIVAKWA